MGTRDSVAGTGPLTWRNWAGNQVAEEVRVLRPRSRQEVADIVRRAAEQGRRLKAVGSGHSFTAIARPEELLLDPSRLSGIHRIDREAGTVTVGAGTRLDFLNEALAAAGLAMANLGDVEVQTISGAISTGTHGTGARFGGLATQVVGLEMVTGEGELVACSESERAELWRSARVGLGALGVLTAVTLSVVPLFALKAEEGPMPLRELLERFDELTASYDHFEAYWFPYTGRSLVKRNTRLPIEVGLDRLPAWREWLDDELLSNTVFGWVLSIVDRRPSLSRTANHLAARALGSRTFTDLSHRVFTSPRRVRFREMEYAIPRQAAPVALPEVIRAVEHSGLEIPFPVELRVAAGDDIPLSTASERDSLYLAFHLPASWDHTAYFGLVERVLAGYQGRPHWGKLHSLDRAALQPLYPRMEDFLAVRASVDPAGIFSNSYLDRVLGPPTGH